MMVTLTYNHDSNVDMLTCTSPHFHVYIYMVLTKQTAEIQGLLVNKVCFHLSLFGCSSGEPGNMHPCNSDACIT